MVKLHTASAQPSICIQYCLQGVVARDNEPPVTQFKQPAAPTPPHSSPSKKVTCIEPEPPVQPLAVTFMEKLLPDGTKVYQVGLSSEVPLPQG